MIMINLFHTFAELTLILFLVRLFIAKWPDNPISRALTFAYA